MYTDYVVYIYNIIHIHCKVQYTEYSENYDRDQNKNRFGQMEYRRAGPHIT